ncbi:unnamed protein product, partial [Rotaria sp. Silwood2]
MIQYHDTDGLMKQQCLAQNPSEEQIQLIDRLCKLKYDQEITRHKMIILKQRISLHKTLHPFEDQSITQLPFIDNINDPNIRQQLYKQYKNVTQQARVDIMTIYMKSVEPQMHE